MDNFGMLNLVFISCIFSVGNGQFFSIYFESIFHTELAKFEHANIAHSNPIQSAVNFIRILSWKLNPIATTDAQCDTQCGTISADIYIPQEKKGIFHKKLKWLMKTFVISLTGDINLYFSQNIQTNTFFFIRNIRLCLSFSMCMGVGVCVRALCVRICGFSYLALLSFVVYSRISFNVMFFRFAVAQLFISDKYGLNKR